MMIMMMMMMMMIIIIIITITMINAYSVARKFPNNAVRLADEGLVTPNYVSLACAGLLTLISIYPDAVSQQLLGSKPVLWVLNITCIA